MFASDAGARGRTKLAPLAMAFLLLPTVVAAQIVRPTNPSLPANPNLPTKPPLRELTQILPDLVIASVKITDQTMPSPVTLAEVRLENRGQADAVFPAGSALVRGDAAQSGGIAFPAMTTPVEYIIAAGGYKILTVSLGDVCAAGNPGAVAFKADPGSVVRETDEGNNANTVQASSFAQGDLRPLGIGFRDAGPLHDERTDRVSSRYPAKESVTLRNEGPGYLLICPNVVIWRETASPVSAKYGLREYRNTTGKPILYKPMAANEMAITEIPDALQPGDLPPGPYTWSVLVNPDGKIRETNGSNNTATGGIAIY